jgi:O-antigen ligase
VLIAAVGALVIVALVLWFVSLESTNRRHVIFSVFVVVVLVEAVIAGGGADVPIGILRPSFFGQDFRIPDAIILAALVARILVAPWRRIGPMAMVWTPFVVVYAMGSVVGFLNDLPAADVLFQSKMLFYIVGGAVVASGADLRRLADSIGTCALVLAPLVPLSLLLGASGWVIAIDLPLQRLPQLGKLSNDTISILVGIGAGALVVETVRPRPRLAVSVAAVVLMLAPLAASQLSLAAVVVMLGLVALGPTWHRRSTVSITQVILGFAGMVGVVLFGFVVTGAPGVLIAQVDDAFGGIGNAQSAESRLSISDQAIRDIAEHPWLGSGVGTKVVAQVPTGVKEVAAHSVVLDLALRVGLIGLVLFVIAVGATAWFGMRVWKFHSRNDSAAVALSAVVMIGAVLAKALVEPATEKYRLSSMIGLSLGLIAVAYSQLKATEVSTTGDVSSSAGPSSLTKAVS